MHFVFTVCDQAAAEPCPLWPGKPITALGSSGSRSVQGPEDVKKGISKAYPNFIVAYRCFINLPFDKLTISLSKEKLDEIDHAQ